MKKLITIILALVMALFTAPNRSADQSHVTAEKPPQTAVITSVEQVPEKVEVHAETAIISEATEVESATAPSIEEQLVKQESDREERTEISDKVILADPKEEIIECIDEGDQCLAEYKPQIGGQQNPFENDIPTEIDDRPIEDYIGEGEDRPGEGKDF